MDIYQRNNTVTKISTPQDVEMSIQDRVLIGAVATVGVLVSLALLLRFLKQPCKHRIENKEEKKEYDRFSSSYSLEDGSSDVSCKTSSSGFSDSSGASSQGTQISYCSSEFSLKSDKSTPLYQSLPDLTGKNNKSLNISSPLIFAMHSGLQEHVSTYPDLKKTDASLTAERLSQKSSNNLDSLLSNSIISLTSSWHTSDTSAKRETTVEHAYGKYLPKHYKSNLAIEEFEKPTKS